MATFAFAHLSHSTKGTAEWWTEHSSAPVHYGIDSGIKYQHVRSFEDEHTDFLISQFSDVSKAWGEVSCQLKRRFVWLTGDFLNVARNGVAGQASGEFLDQALTGGC